MWAWPTPWELYTERLDECWNLLDSIAGVRTVRLSPSAFAVLARQGWGEAIVRETVRLLLDSGLARLRWEVSGMERVPVVEPWAA